jgi:hypothetical protein
MMPQEPTDVPDDTDPGEDIMDDPDIPPDIIVD